MLDCDWSSDVCSSDLKVKKKDNPTTGRYVDTDYGKCIGCHICADVCPTGYIVMGMGD
jgi:formate hydrogenlyase subunit 6/NADH:ubiquinone oxidoreductase subunit I